MSGKSTFGQNLRASCPPALMVFCVFLAGCASTKPRHQWTDGALEAETMQARGELEVARARYEELLPEAPTNERRRWMTFNLGMLELEAGNRTEGVEILEALIAEPTEDLYGASAAYELAQLHDETAPERADELRRALIRRFPDQVAAEFALQDLVGHAQRDAGAAGDAVFGPLLETLSSLHADVADSELGDNLLFEIARIEAEFLGDHDDALSTLRRLYAEYRKGPLADDALWEMANIYRAHQMWEPAVQALELLADSQESSWFVGSYDSDWVDDAIYDLGMIHLLYLDDYRGAIRWLTRYLDDYPLGFMNDDAAWNIVQALRLGGDRDGYERALAEFVRDFPESRWVRLARHQMGGPDDRG